MNTPQIGIKAEDPIIASLAIPCHMRSNLDLVPIIDFVQGLKIFSSFSSHPETVFLIASKLELQDFYNGSYIFQEGAPGYHFYIILEGEISIVKKKRIVEMSSETVVLVKLGCGQYFGENALQSKEGLRTASALATKKTRLLVLHVDDYQNILSGFKDVIRVQVRKTLSSSTCILRFMKAAILDQLSTFVTVRNYPMNHEIVSHGSRMSSLYLIKSGIVKIIKPIPKEGMQSAIAAGATRVVATANALNKERMPRIIHAKTSASTTIHEVRVGGGGGLTPIKKTRTLHAPNSSSSSSGGGHDHSRGGMSSPLPGEQHFGPETPPPGYWLLSGAEDEGNRVEKNIDLGLGEDFTASAKQSANKGNRSGAADSTVEFTISVLLSGSVFGELSLLDPEQLSPCSFVSATVAEVYCFDSEILVRLGVLDNQRIMSTLADDWKFRNPPVEEVRKQLQYKYEQECYKKKALAQQKMTNIYKKGGGG